MRLERIDHALTGINLAADLSLQSGLGKRPIKDLAFGLLWNDADAIGIAEDQVARSDTDLVDCDRTAKIHDIVAALQAVGVATVSEGGKVQR